MYYRDSTSTDMKGYLRCNLLAATIILHVNLHSVIFRLYSNLFPIGEMAVSVGNATKNFVHFLKRINAIILGLYDSCPDAFVTFM